MFPDGPPRLSETDRALLSFRADQFHDAVVCGPVADWEPFLAGLTGSVRIAVLTELAVIDLGHRWERGERPAAADYVRRFPELGPNGQVPPDLAAEERRCRMMAEQPPGPAGDPDPLATRPAGPDTADESGAPPGWEPAGVLSASVRYVLVRKIGQGQFAEVWLARKEPSGIEVAVKVLLRPAGGGASGQERRALELVKNLRHPFLLTTEDFWVADDRLHVVTELADGTLRDRLAAVRRAGRPGVPPGELVGYVREAADGLDYLHAHEITHRDVKPDNILVQGGHAKVADFGLAQRGGAEPASASLAGTPAYMAPEVWDGGGGPASDQYALARTYLELRQGRPPTGFAGFVRRAERAVLRRATARDPADRYPTCSAFAEALRRVVRRPSGRRFEPAHPRRR